MKKLHTTRRRLDYKRLTSFVIGDDGDKPSEGCTITVMYDVHKPILPIRYMLDATFSLL